MSSLSQKVFEFDTHTEHINLHDITKSVSTIVARCKVRAGMCHVFVQHTSCSLIIQERSDPRVRDDLQAWISRLAPDGDPRYTHSEEGPDDMPAHLKSAITKTSELIPIVNGQLGLGIWQGLFLWEHRRRGCRRKIVVSVFD